MLNTVKKIGPVLELFTAQRPEWHMTEIARALGMPKSSTHSLLASLVDIGLLAPGSRGRYRLGWNLLTLSDRMRACLDFREHALEPMRELAEATREKVLLAALDRHCVVYVERVEATHPTVRVAGVRVGTRSPAYCTAVGKVLLAHCDPEHVRTLLAAHPMQPLTPHTITTIEALEQQLARVRATGVAFDDGEVSEDVGCVAAPIHDRSGDVVAAISVSMPLYRFHERHRHVVEPLERAVRSASGSLAHADDAARSAEPAISD